MYWLSGKVFIHSKLRRWPITFVPALAGFQSEHEVEIPFMLTTENDDSETGRTGIETAAHWRCLVLF